MKKLLQLLFFKRFIGIIVLGLMLCGYNSISAQTSMFNWNKIDPELRADLENSTRSEQPYKVIVVMQEQYDQATMAQLTRYMNRQDRREFVVNEMKTFTQNSQNAVIQALGSYGMSVNEIQQYWIFNGFACEAESGYIAMLSNREDIDMIFSDNEQMMIPEEWNPVPAQAKGNAWNVTKVRAEEVWALNGDTGYTGDGIVVAVIDSGVNYNHTDIANNMWDGGEEYPNHGYDWVNGDYDPIDDHGHGSHCAGTVAGYGTSGTQTGIAKGAKIMALKTLSAGGNGYNSNTLLAMQFALEHNADVLSMSLGTSGLGGFYYYRDTMITLMNAGVVASVAASNDGWRLSTMPIPYNIGAPGNCPPPFLHPDQKDILPGGTSATISIGATDQDDVHTWFTSVGPSTWSAGSYIGDYNDYPYTEGSATEIGLIRPDVAAPGEDITSLDYSDDTGYCIMSGTSMATPCAAGVMALMLEANPMLLPRQIDSILEYTAVRCEGSTSKNNYTGSGRIDAYEAVNAAVALKFVNVDDVLYNVDDDNMTAEVKGHIEGISADGNLVLPASITYTNEQGEQVYTVTSIAEGAFAGYSNIQKLSIPRTVETIGDAAFSGCSGLNYMTVLATTPPTLGNAKSGDVFEGVDKNITVVVPSGASAAYQSASGWNEFTNIQEITNHWNYEELGNVIPMTGVLAIDEIEQRNDMLEIGAFCNGECRGSAIAFYFALTDRYYVMLSVFSDNDSGDTITFKLYDHVNDCEMNVSCDNTIVFQDEDQYGSISDPYGFYFRNGYIITATVNPEEAGYVTGTGIYQKDEQATLTAYANNLFVFENWTEGGVIVSTAPSLIIDAVNSDRNFVANFREITNHWIPVPNLNYSMTVTGKILIDNIEQRSNYLEVGAFCGNECRGSAIAQYIPQVDKYAVMLYIGSDVEEGETITFHLYDHLIEDSLWVKGLTILTFHDDTDYGSINDLYPIMFSTTYTVTITTNPDDAGTVTGAGEYFYGDVAELMAYSDVEGYRFKGWIINDTLYTDNPHYLTVTHDYDVVAEYYKVHKETLAKNWTWWSTYIEMEGVDGLTMLEDALSANGDSLQSGDKILTKNKYSEYVGGGIWIRNNLSNINNETGYKIHVSGQSDVEMYGDIANPESHPITIKAGVWNWIGYPVSVTQNVSVLLDAIDAENGDKMLGQNGYTEYYAGTWFSSIGFKLRPGKGYKYQSHASNDKVLHYNAVSTKGEVEVDEEISNYWVNNPYAYPDVMSITAVVNVDGVEQENLNLEVGAFVNGECRGSAHLQYIEVTNRYYAMLTVAGENGDIVEFGLVDKEHNLINREGLTKVVFSDDVVLGGIGSPYEVDFGAMEEINGGDLWVYPNPVERGESFTISIPTNEKIKEIVVTNAMGAIVKRAQTTLNMVERGLPVSGVYMVNVVCNSGNVYYSKLIVK